MTWAARQRGRRPVPLCRASSAVSLGSNMERQAHTHRRSTPLRCDDLSALARAIAARINLFVLARVGHGTGFQAIAPSGLTPSTRCTSVPSEVMVNSCRVPGCTKAAWDPSGAVLSVN